MPGWPSQSCTRRGSTPRVEEAVIQTRVEADQEEARAEQVNDAVDTIMETLHSYGYKPTLRIEDVEVQGGGPVPGWNTLNSTISSSAGAPAAHQL
jgi:hypothetical protein